MRAFRVAIAIYIHDQWSPGLAHDGSMAAPISRRAGLIGWAALLVAHANEDTIQLRNGLRMPANGLGTCCRKTARGQPIIAATKAYLRLGGRLRVSSSAIADIQTAEWSSFEVEKFATLPLRGAPILAPYGQPRYFKVNVSDARTTLLLQLLYDAETPLSGVVEEKAGSGVFRSDGAPPAANGRANAAQSTILAIGADIAWGKAPLGVAAVTMRGVRQPSPRQDYLRDRADSRFFAVFFANQE